MMRQTNPQATLDKSSFDVIAALAHRESGLNIVPEKMMMVQSRLRHRLRALDLPDFQAYSRLLGSTQGSEERRHMISALTTNVSHFFREPHHFELLTQRLAPRLKHRILSGDRIRIWSAGCSNGQEPYSIAMHLVGREPALADADFKILATDIDPKVVTFAQQGTYPSQFLSGLSQDDTSRFMQDADGGLRVVDTIRKCVAFRELNLLADWPMRQRFDAIFCRNVVIYFDLETQARLWPRFREALADDGMFFLGHSERVMSPDVVGFTSIGPTAYMKTPATTAQSAPHSGGRNGTS